MLLTNGSSDQSAINISTPQCPGHIGEEKSPSKDFLPRVGTTFLYDGSLRGGQSASWKAGGTTPMVTVVIWRPLQFSTCPHLVGRHESSPYLVYRFCWACFWAHILSLPTWLVLEPLQKAFIIIIFYFFLRVCNKSRATYKRGKMWKLEFWVFSMPTKVNLKRFCLMFPTVNRLWAFRPIFIPVRHLKSNHLVFGLFTPLNALSFHLAPRSSWT